MNIFLKNKEDGFTLIELLVVVSIIGLLSSVVLTSVSSARAKARDAQRKVEFNQLFKALTLYFDKYGKYPNQGNNIPPTTTAPYYTDNFKDMADELVLEKFLSKVPVSPCGSTCSASAGGYEYFNYSGGPYDGAFIITFLETGPSTTTGVSPSCRQTTGSNNFCYSSNSKQYCMCLPNK